jgi:hypothetical protein
MPFACQVLSASFFVYDDTSNRDGEILLVLYDEAAYLKDDSDGVRILFTEVQDKQKVHDEIRRLIEEHGQKEQRPDEFRKGRER